MVQSDSSGKEKERKSPEREMRRSWAAAARDCRLIARNLPFHSSELRERGGEDFVNKETELRKAKRVFISSFFVFSLDCLFAKEKKKRERKRGKLTFLLAFMSAAPWSRGLSPTQCSLSSCASPLFHRFSRCSSSHSCCFPTPFSFWSRWHEVQLTSDADSSRPPFILSFFFFPSTCRIFCLLWETRRN